MQNGPKYNIEIDVKKCAQIFTSELGFGLFTFLKAVLRMFNIIRSSIHEYIYSIVRSKFPFVSIG